ncbi:MAG: hypothetical protein ACFFCQ_08630, partial [Promethearchaeota archaeon]
AEINDATPDEEAGMDFQDTDIGTEGLIYYYIWAMDNVGNNGTVAFDTITIDLSDPIPLIFNPGNDTWWAPTGNLTVGCTITEDNLDYVTQNNSLKDVNSTISSPFEFNLTLSDELDGIYTIWITAYDLAGNIGVTSVIIHIDSNTPTISIDTPLDESWYNETVDNITISVTWAVIAPFMNISQQNTLNDANQTLIVGPANPWNFTLNIADDLEGNYLLRVIIYDQLGRWVDESITFYIDRTDPEIALTSPNNGTIINQGVNSSLIIRFSPTDNMGLDYTIQQNTFGSINPNDTTCSNAPWEFTFNLTSLSDREYYIYLVIYDKAGHTVTMTVLILLDNTPPDLHSLVYSPTIPTFLDSVKFSVNATDPSIGSGVNIITIYYSLDNSTWFSEDFVYNASSNLYTAIIPNQMSDNTVYHYLNISDKVGNTFRTPTYSYSVIPRSTSLTALLVNGTILPNEATFDFFVDQNITFYLDWIDVNTDRSVVELVGMDNITVDHYGDIYDLLGLKYRVDSSPSTSLPRSINIMIVLESEGFIDQVYQATFLIHERPTIYPIQLANSSKIICEASSFWILYLWSDGFNQNISEANIQVLINGSITTDFEFRMESTGLYNITLDTSELDVGIYTIIFNFTKLGYKTQKAETSIMVMGSLTIINLENLSQYVNETAIFTFTVFDHQENSKSNLPVLWELLNTPKSGIATPLGAGEYKVEISCSMLEVNQNYILNVSTTIPYYYSCSAQASLTILPKVKTLLQWVDLPESFTQGENLTFTVRLSFENGTGVESETIYFLLVLRYEGTPPSVMRGTFYRKVELEYIFLVDTLTFNMSDVTDEGGYATITIDKEYTDKAIAIESIQILYPGEAGLMVSSLNIQEFININPPAGKGGGINTLLVTIIIVTLGLLVVTTSKIVPPLVQKRKESKEKITRDLPPAIQKLVKEQESKPSVPPPTPQILDKEVAKAEPTPPVPAAAPKTPHKSVATTKPKRPAPAVVPKTPRKPVAKTKPKRPAPATVPETPRKPVPKTGPTPPIPPVMPIDESEEAEIPPITPSSKLSVQWIKFYNRQGKETDDFEVGSTINIQIMVVDEKGKPVSGAKVHFTVEKPTGSESTLNYNTLLMGYTKKAYHTLKTPGTYIVKVTDVFHPDLEYTAIANVISSATFKTKEVK